MSSHHPSDRTTTEPEKSLGLNAAQVVGSALAAVSAAVASSFLGVAGTIIGAALASVVATIGGAVYTASLRRGREVVLRTGTSSRPTDWVSRVRSTVIGVSWRRVGLGAAAALVLALGTLTALERFAGAPVSAIAQSEDGAGTTLGAVISGRDDATAPESPDPDDAPPADDGTGAEPTEEPTAEPTEEPTAEPTEEPTAEPTEEPTAESTEEPTVEPTEEPTAESTEEPSEEPAEEPAAESTP